MSIPRMIVHEGIRYRRDDAENLGIPVPNKARRTDEGTSSSSAPAAGDEAPVKRGPGRPRKDAANKAEAAPTGPTPADTAAGDQAPPWAADAD